MKGLRRLLLVLPALAAACVFARDVEPLPRLESGCYAYAWDVVSDACWPDGLPLHPEIPMEVTLSSGADVSVETSPSMVQLLVPSLFGTRENETFTAAGSSVLVVTSDCSLSVTDLISAEASPVRNGRPTFAATLDVQFDANVLNVRGEPSHCEAQAGQLFFPGIPLFLFPTLSDPVNGACVIRVHGHGIGCDG